MFFVHLKNDPHVRFTSKKTLSTSNISRCTPSKVFVCINIALDNAGDINSFCCTNINAARHIKYSLVDSKEKMHNEIQISISKHFLINSIFFCWKKERRLLNLWHSNLSILLSISSFVARLWFCIFFFVFYFLSSLFVIFYLLLFLFRLNGFICIAKINGD